MDCGLKVSSTTRMRASRPVVDAARPSRARRQERNRTRDVRKERRRERASARASMIVTPCRISSAI